MKNPEISTGIENSKNGTPVKQVQVRTREKVFKALGSTLELGWDTTKFGAEATAYSFGRAYRTALDTKDAFNKGKNNESFQTAA